MLGWLVVSNPLKNMKVNRKDYPIYEMENKIHVPNHQPVIMLGFMFQYGKYLWDLYVPIWWDLHVMFQSHQITLAQ